MRLARTLLPGHPDKACDLIAETIVDEYLRRDPAASLRVHVAGGRGALFVTGVVSSTADFDVGAIVKQTAASLGVQNDVEPFVAMESVSGSELLEATRTSRPTAVIGYATSETEEGIPMALALSRRIAKKLHELRTRDTDWYWLEPGGEVTVTEPKKGMPMVYITCGHGARDLAEVRDLITGVAKGTGALVHVKVNENGPVTQYGLDHDIGSSGAIEYPYGSGVPLTHSPIGCDPSQPFKFGSWLARAVAQDALKRSGTKAVMVSAIYHPRDAEPSALLVRDEKGNDLTTVSDRDSMRFSRLIEQIRPGLNAESARWGYAGEDQLPWEL